MDAEMKHNIWKLQAFYLLSFFAVGSLTPLLSVYLNDEAGLNGMQIGTIMSIGPIVMMVLQPIWGMICDRTGKPEVVLFIASAAAGLFGLSYVLADSYYGLLMVSILLAVFQSAIIPVSDSISLQYTTRVKGNYGKVRMFGSLGFAVAVFLMGRFSEVSGLQIIFFAFFFGLSVSGFLALAFPREPVEKEIVKSSMKEGLKELLRSRRFIVFLLVTFLLFGPNLANNVYYGLFIEGSGGTYAGIGIAFLLAVLSEVPFMRFAGSWIYKIGILPVIFMAAAASALRFLFYFTEPSIAVIYATSIIQGFSLGLFIPAGLQYVQQIVPPHITVTAVTIYSAFGNGLGNWFSTFAGGFLLERYGIYSVYMLFGVFCTGAMLLAGRLYVLEKRAGAAASL